MNNNDQIEKKELKKFVDMVYDFIEKEDKYNQYPPYALINKIVEKLLHDHNGKISCESFIDYCRKDELLMKFLNSIL